MSDRPEEAPGPSAGKAKGPPPRKPLFPNPFYVLLLISSTAFVLTALLYYISPFVVERGLQRPKAAPSPGSLALVKWLDRNGPLALGIQFVVMLASGSLAMATDHWFPSKGSRQRSTPQAP